MTKGLFIRIDPVLDRNFSEICKKEGYKKSGLVTKLIRDFVEKKPGTKDPIQEASDFGIDISLLSSSLRKTPTERMETNRALLEFKEEARKAREKAAHANS